MVTGPNTNNTCNGILITLSAAPNIAGNKFNFNNSLTTYATTYFNPATNEVRSFEPIRIVDNFEGNRTGIAFYNSCPSVSSYLLSHTDHDCRKSNSADGGRRSRWL